MGLAEVTPAGHTARWRGVLNETWRLNRVHAGPETTRAYQRLAESYPNTRLISFPSGERSGSWVAPEAWEVGRARLVGPDGDVIVDTSDQPLGVFAYSPPFTGRVSLQELQAHLFSDPGRPAATPFHFRNQYRHPVVEWGFCLPHEARARLREGEYAVEIDSRFIPGNLEMVEQVHRGSSADALLLVGHFDHPAQCNDGLVGCLAGHEALTRLAGTDTRLTYRMLSTIEIVGSVFYAEREAAANQVREALFVATAGANAEIAYQTSVSERAFVDRAMRQVLRHAAPGATIRPFRSLFGNDEIAFEAPGVAIPCGSLSRYPYAEYHTSDDTPAAVSDTNFEAVVEMILQLIEIAERNSVFSARFTGLPRLASPELNLYLGPPTMSGAAQAADDTVHRVLARLQSEASRSSALAASANFFRLMNLVAPLADGSHSVLDLAERADVPFAVAAAYTDLWVERGLLEKVWRSPFPAR